MSIRELEEKLFDEWQEKEKLGYNSENKKLFVRDGLIHEESYFKAPVKILYLLKEVNGGDKDWDLREFVKKEGIDLGDDITTIEEARDTILEYIKRKDRNA